MMNNNDPKKVNLLKEIYKYWYSNLKYIDNNWY